MFDNIKKEIYFKKMDLLFHKGLFEEKIVPFDDKFYERMSHTYFGCIPVSMHIKYLKPLDSPGKCKERSLFMFCCFDDALLVRVNIKDLELRFGKEYAGHGWIEIGDYVYDPSLTLRFDKDLYYKIYNPSNIYKYTKKEYRETNKKYYDMIKNTTISDFQPGGSKRTDLCTVIPLIRQIAEYSCDENFKKDLDEYLSLIQYDEKQVYEELVSKCNSLIRKNK